MLQQKLHTNWKMRRMDSGQWRPAVVPGTVYTDLLRNGDMEDPFWKDNENKAYELMEYDYEYETSFSCEEALLACSQVKLHFDGLDTIADIYLNGCRVGEAYNMHRIWEFEVKHLLNPEENTLRIVLYSPNRYIREKFQECRTMGSEDAMDGFVHIRKAHCMFGWDWGAHLPDAGIFRPVSLLGIQTARIDSVYIRQEHETDRVKLHLQVETEYAETSCAERSYAEKSCTERSCTEISYQVILTDPSGKQLVFPDSPKEIAVEDPMLWWPNGYGEQALYTVCVQLKQEEAVIDQWERRIGLRTMTMKIEKDAWGESFAHEVNGISVFAMGADYIPEDHLLGRVTPETTRTLLEECKAANFNAIRVWGGGYYPEDWFFDLCDELGLMVWQDFMFACAVYELTPEFEANIRQEFIDNVKRIRHHASLGLWCGNNEMEMFVAEKHHWVTKPTEVRDYLFMYERLIPQVLSEYDPQTFYWPASPSSGGSFDEPNDPNRGDVHYWKVWHGNRPFSEYRKFYFRYASEFGFQSLPAFETVKTFTDDPKDWNMFSYIMEKHQRQNSANGKLMNYLQQTYLYPSDFRTLIYATQLLQADAIRYGVEHFRRNRGRCMGAIYWQLNDCWPVVSWSSIDYCGRLKALHYYARRFFAPVMISCHEEGWMTQEADMNREHFEFEKSIRLNVANETRQEISVEVRWAVRNAKAQILRQEKTSLTVPALTSQWLDKVELPELDVFTEYVSYELYQNGEQISDGTVIFSFPKYFRYEDPKLAVEVDGDELVVSAQAYAKSVEILNETEDLKLSDNYFDMNGGTKRIRIISGKTDGLKVRSVYQIR